MSVHDQQNDGSHTARHTILADLSAQILKLEARIAELTHDKQVLEQARAYILSSNSASQSGFHTPHPNSRVTPGSSSSRASSNLRQQAIVRSALECNGSPSPSGTSGLLASEDFEEAFAGDTEVLMSVEDQRVPARIDSNNASVSVAASSTASTKDASITSSPAIGKRAKKRKRQENAAKAREVRRRKLDGNGGKGR